MPVHEQELGQGLILRAVRDERDAEHYIALNAMVNGKSESIMCARLLYHHPAISYDDFLLVEDQRTGEVVSTTCLIPWQLSYDGILLNTAMLEMVVTHPEYRRRGLVRAQIQCFHHTVTERDFDLSIIQGIPFYYRQFGYAYALDHRPYDSLPAWRIPDRSEDGMCQFGMRPARVDDASALTHLYDDSLVATELYTLRSLNYWQFLLQATQYPVWLIEDMRTGRAAGYTIHSPLGDGNGVDVIESGMTGHEAAMSVLRQFKAEITGEIRLGGTGTTTLVRAGRSLGSVPLVGNQWLVRIRDVAAFLTRISVVLESRLASSDCSGFTGDLSINLFREAVVLRFVAGKLTKVDAVGFMDASLGADGGDLCIPPDAFVRLIFGYRDLSQLRDAWPDIVIKPHRIQLLEILFPRMTSCIWMPY